MPVLDHAAGHGNIFHAFGPEFVQFGERRRFVVTLLVRAGEQAAFFGDDIVLQFSHRLEGHPGPFLEGFRCLEHCLEWIAFEGIAVLVVETADHGQGRNLRERVHESRAEVGNHIEVAASCLHE